MAKYFVTNLSLNNKGPGDMAKTSQSFFYIQINIKAASLKSILVITRVFYLLQFINNIGEHILGKTKGFKKWMDLLTPTRNENEV